MQARLLLVALVLLSSESVVAATVAQSTKRFNVEMNEWLVYETIWYPDSACGTMPVQAIMWSPRTLSQECDAEGSRQLQAFLSPYSGNVVDPTQCYTYSTAVTYDGGCYVRCRNGYCTEAWLGGVDPALCTVTISSSTRANAVYYPDFIIQSVNYVLPGIDSYISYTNESGRGSTWGTEWSFGNELQVSLDSILKGAGLAAAFSTKGSTLVTAKSTASASSVFPSYSDQANYLKDEFTVWLNPKMTKYTGCGFPDHVVYSAASGSRTYLPPGQDTTKPILERFTAEEFLNPFLAVDPWRRDFLEQVSLLGSYEKVLNVDPRIRPDGTANPDPFLDPARFRPVDPDNTCPTAFAGVRADGPLDCVVRYNYSHESSSALNYQRRVSASLPGGISDTLTFSYSTTYKQENTTGNAAQLHIATSTSNVCISGQIYIDTLFNTYIVNGTTSTCSQP